MTVSHRFSSRDVSLYLRCTAKYTARSTGREARNRPEVEYASTATVPASPNDCAKNMLSSNGSVSSVEY